MSEKPKNFEVQKNPLRILEAICTQNGYTVTELSADEVGVRAFQPLVPSGSSYTTPSESVLIALKTELQNELGDTQNVEYKLWPIPKLTVERV